MFRGGNRTDIFLDQRLQRFQIHVAYEGERKAVRTRVERFEGFRQIFERDAFQGLDRQRLLTRIVAVKRFDRFYLHDVVGIRGQVLDVCLVAVHRRVEILLREAGTCEVLVEQLEHRFDVFGRAVTAHTVAVVIDVQVDSGFLACELLVQFDCREFAHSRLGCDDRKEFTFLHLRIGKLRHPAVSLYLQQDFVRLELGRFDDDLHTVLENPFGRSEILVVCGLLHGRAFQLDICGDQRLADGIVLVSLDVGCHDLAADGQKFGFGRLGQSFFLRYFDGDNLVFRCQKLFYPSIHIVEGQCFEVLFVEVVLRFGICHSGIFLVIRQVGLNILSVCKVVPIGIGSLGLTQEFSFRTIEFALCKAVTLHLLHLFEDSFVTAEQLSVSSLYGDHREILGRIHSQYVA